jgi:hypothetical protein
MTFRLDSSVATRVVVGKGHRSRSYIPRTSPVRAIIIHTTGSGPARRLTSSKFAKWRRRNPEAAVSTFEAALWVYQNMVPGPHYVVGQEGECAQTAPEMECAWHVGSAQGRRYKWTGGRWSTRDTAWWFKRWPGLQSPRELANGHLWDPYTAPLGLRGIRARIASRWAGGGGSVNANTLGIEVAPDLAKPGGPWSEAALLTLDRLVLDLAHRHQVPLAREFIFGHSDANPIARSSRGRGWDPSEAQWDFASFAERTGIWRTDA